MNTPSIAVVIVNWNGCNDTLLCLDSLRMLKHDLHTIIVVDNGSTDGLVEKLRVSYPWVTCIALAENKGFAEGNNIGITYAQSKGASYIWLLNNDTIVDKHTLSLVRGFTDDTVGACGSKIYFMKGREYHKDRYETKEKGRVLWYAGGLIDWENMYASHRGVDEVDHGQYDQMEETPYITGCSLMVRSDVVEKIGLLSTDYFMYLEDLEYCLRMHTHGYKTVYVPSSLVWHKNAGSSGGSGSAFHVYYQTRNRLFVGLRYAPLRTKCALLRQAARFLISGSKEERKAVRDALLGKKGKGI